MQAATAHWSEFAPPQPPAQLRALALAIAAHLLLLGALTWGVTWKHQSDTTLTVEAELWSAVPRQAAPTLAVVPPPPPVPAPVARPAPPPPPPPAPDLAQRDAGIALARQKQAQALAAQQHLEEERKQRQKLEQKRLAQEKLEKDRLKQAADDKKAAGKKAAQEAQHKEALKQEALKKEEAARADKELRAQRDANLRHMVGLAGASGGETATGTALRASAPSASYAGKVAARVKPNIVFTDNPPGNPSAEVDVRAAPDGSILSRQLVRSSGFKAWDDAVLKAIEKTAKLPLDSDGRVPAAMIITFRPRD